MKLSVKAAAEQDRSLLCSDSEPLTLEVSQLQGQGFKPFLTKMSLPKIAHKYDLVVICMGSVDVRCQNDYR